MRINFENKHISFHEEEMNEKVAIEDLDKIREYDADTIMISGLLQKTFDYFIEHNARDFKKIKFWKIPRVDDLSALETLSDVEEIEIFWNQKSHEFWDLSKNKRLETLIFHDCNNMKDLSALAGAPALRKLTFGNYNDSKYAPKSLEPLTQIQNLEVLLFNAKAIEDNKIAPLSEIRSLKELGFNSSLFSREKLAWLKAHVHEGLESGILQGHSEFTAYGENPETRDKMMIHGKRKPTLSKNKYQKRIQKYIEEFEAAIKFYKDNPDTSEPE